MKKYIFTFAAAFLTLIATPVLVQNEFIPAPQEKILRHVVLLNLNEEATDAVLRNMEKDLQGLKKAIPQIKELEFGANIHSDTDYSHCMLLTFENVESLKKYEGHPQHLEFASTYGPYVIKKTEVDYWYTD